MEEEKFNHDIFNIDDDDELDDIEFDDNIDFEEIAKQFHLRAKGVDLSSIPKDSSIEVENIVNLENISALPVTVSSDAEQILSQPLQNNIPENLQEQSVLKPEDFPKNDCKKYVVYITPNNVEYVDSLSIDERTELINNVIQEEYISNTRSKRIEARQKYIKHLIVVCIVVIISFPISFFLINKSLQASIINFQQSQQNFQKLYKEKGKITSYQKVDLRD